MKAIVPALRAQSDTFNKVDRAARLMILYPLVYILLTLPLSAGRMWSMAHHGASLPNAYQCIAGALLSSSGWVDAALYTLTRKTLLAGGSSRPLASNGRNDGKGSDKSGNMEVTLSDLPGGITQTRTVTVTGHVLNLPSDDEDEERGRKTSKTVYHQFDRPTHSPTGSLDPIISTVPIINAERTVGEKGVKFASDIRVTSTALDDASDDDRSLEANHEHSTSTDGHSRNGFRNFSRSS